jgi:predicted DNA binding CopG/RHH family protein
MPQPKPKKIGRPKLPRGDSKRRIVQVRFNSDDLKRIMATAKARGMTVSEWIRSTLNAAAS